MLQRELHRISVENASLLHRLENCRPIYSHEQWQKARRAAFRPNRALRPPVCMPCPAYSSRITIPVPVPVPTPITILLRTMYRHQHCTPSAVVADA